MILQYLKRKEKKEKKISNLIYLSILKEASIFINKQNYFKDKNYNTSFEIISILLVFHFIIISNRKYHNSRLINEFLIQNFISDLDESLRSNGIGDMSIGKYVKTYVKKFYYRLSKIDKLSSINKNNLSSYFQSFNFVKEEEIMDFSNDLESYYLSIEKSFNINDFRV